MIFWALLLLLMIWTKAVITYILVPEAQERPFTPSLSQKRGNAPMSVLHVPCLLSRRQYPLRGCLSWHVPDKANGFLSRNKAERPMKSQIYPCSLLLLCFLSIVNLLRSRVKSVLCRSGFPSVACKYEIWEFQNNPWPKFSGVILIFGQNQPHHLHIMRYKRMCSFKRLYM